MNQISPVYKRKVTKDNFKNLVVANSVLKEIKQIYMAAKTKQIQKNFRPQRHKEIIAREEEKCLT